MTKRNSRVNKKIQELRKMLPSENQMGAKRSESSLKAVRKTCPEKGQKVKHFSWLLYTLCFRAPFHLTLCCLSDCISRPLSAHVQRMLERRPFLIWIIVRPDMDHCQAWYGSLSGLTMILENSFVIKFYFSWLLLTHDPISGTLFYNFKWEVDYSHCH